MKLGKKANDDADVGEKHRDVSLIATDETCDHIYVSVWELMYDFDFTNFDGDLETLDELVDEKIFLMEVITDGIYMYVPHLRKNELRMMCPGGRVNLCMLKYDADIISMTRRGSHLLILLNNNHIFIYAQVVDAEVYKWTEVKHLKDVKEINPNLLSISNSVNRDLVMASTMWNGRNNCLQIYNPYDDNTLVTFKAHKSKLACVSLNNDGNLVATGSVSGRVIRVWWCADDKGHLMFEFRRSFLSGVDISSLVFTQDSTCLASFGDNCDVHIYRIHTSPYILNKESLEDLPNRKSFFPRPLLVFDIPKGVTGIKCHEFESAEDGLDLMFSDDSMILRIFELSEEGKLLFSKHFDTKERVSANTLRNGLQTFQQKSNDEDD